MKKIIVLILVLLLAGCSKVTEAEQFISDNPEVLDGEPIVNFSNETVDIEMYDIIENDNNKIFYAVDTDELIFIFVYCESSNIDFTLMYEERIYSSDTYYGLFDKPVCESDESAIVYYNFSEETRFAVNIGQISK